jgi:hypothetical protein
LAVASATGASKNDPNPHAMCTTSNAFIQTGSPYINLPLANLETGKLEAGPLATDN